MRQVAFFAIFVAFCIAFVSHAHAAPFIVSDPDPTGASDKCFYQEGVAAAVGTPVVAAGCKIDASAFPVGAHSLQVWFSSTLWGVTSVKANFSFTRPSATATGPTNLQLSP